MRRLSQPDPDDVAAETVYCFGCGRTIGVTSEEKMAVYCEPLCWYKEQLVAIDTAVRNRAFHYLTEAGLAKEHVADAFGVTRARVNQVLAQSNDDDYLARFRKEPTTAALRRDRTRAGKLGGASRWSTARK